VLLYSTHLFVHIIFLIFFVLFYCSLYHLVFPSFPTRRSSDLCYNYVQTLRKLDTRLYLFLPRHVRRSLLRSMTLDKTEMSANVRSEEHTSELQSRFDLVCRLLLAKKKNK